MPEAVDTHDEMEDRLKSTLWYHIGKLVDEETINLGVNATPQFIGSLTELVWAQVGKDAMQIATVAVDLESFANHAGRSKIKSDDVLLLTRRNEGLATIIKQRIETLVQEKQQRLDKSK